MQTLSTISRSDLLAINDLAISESPGNQAKLGFRLAELNLMSKTEEVTGGLTVGGIATVAVTGLEIAQLGSMSELETIYEFPPELQHPAEQVTACLAMLRKMEEDSTDGGDLLAPSKFTYDQVQRRLSRLLVDHPVMMDARIIVGVKTVAGPGFTTVASALADLSFAALPCETHGLTKRELRIFAGKESVRKGINEASPQTGATRTAVRGCAPLNIACKGQALPTATNATRGAFLASLLELSHLATIQTGRALIDYRYRGAGDRDGYFKAMTSIFWDVALTGGRNSNLSPGQLAQTLLLPAPFCLADSTSLQDPPTDWTVANFGSHQKGDVPGMTGHLGLGLTNTFEERLFSVGGDASTGYAAIKADALRDRTLGTIKLLAASGLTESEHQAAHTLGVLALGHGRATSSSAGPVIPMESAFGFLDALHAYGVTPVQVFQVGRGSDTWANALRIHSATKAMEGVFASIPGGMVAQPGSGNDAPARQARRNRMV